MANEGQSKRGENCHSSMLLQCVITLGEDVHYVDTMFVFISLWKRRHKQSFPRDRPLIYCIIVVLHIIFLLETRLDFLFERR